MLALLFSRHLRTLFILTIVAYAALLALGALWCCARTCCIVPRRARQCIGLLCCAALFVAAALTAYTLSEVHASEREARLFF